MLNSNQALMETNLQGAVCHGSYSNCSQARNSNMTLWHTFGAAIDTLIQTLGDSSARRLLSFLISPKAEANWNWPAGCVAWQIEKSPRGVSQLLRPGTFYCPHQTNTENKGFVSVHEVPHTMLVDVLCTLNVSKVYTRLYKLKYRQLCIN